MKLVKLECDQPSFRPILFNDTGITFIIGTSHVDSEGSSNGVGKTLSLDLVHHCLGANPDIRLSHAVPHWVFILHFEINNIAHVIHRSGDSKLLQLDGIKISQNKLCLWLDQSGLFHHISNIPNLSFRSLFKRFSRYKPEDSINPLVTKQETPYASLLNSSFLLGLDYSLVRRKHDLIIDLKNTDQAKKNWKKDTVLHEMFRAGAEPKVRYKWLEKEIPRLVSELDRFQVAENYRAIELEAGDLTRNIRESEKNLAILNFQIENINKSLELHPDISKEDLLSLYSGLQILFKPEALAHFDAVEGFHNSLTINRKARLEADKIHLLNEQAVILKNIAHISAQRDSKLQMLQGKRALDEYATVAKQLAIYEEEKARLKEFLNFTENLQNKSLDIRQHLVQDEAQATEYLESSPLNTINSYFTKAAEILYPRAASGIIANINSGDKNQIRYNITVQIEGDSSDGINSARILCFDWVLFMYGSNHNMNMLWHDNRLFAHVDPRARAAWFDYVHKSLMNSNKQYIATINTENFESMKPYLNEDVWHALQKCTALTLDGDNVKHKLLGIQFDKPSA